MTLLGVHAGNLTIATPKMDYIVFHIVSKNGLFLGLGQGSQNVFGPTHVDEQLLFSMFSPVLTFDFDLIWG